jgi:hypothetical protein
MIIVQILLAAGAFGILGFIFYWFGVALHAGPEATKEEINNNPHKI